MKFELSGFDEVQRYLREIADAAKTLDGTIAELKINPDDPEPAIRQMELAIDNRVAGLKSNPTVNQMVAAMKQQYAKQIRERARKARERNADS